MKAILMLEDGSRFSGEALGVSSEKCGEVILNTAVVGYQEMITDPANAAKILVLTYPLIGNYGIAPKFNASKKAWLSGLVIKEKSRIFSNWQARGSFDAFIKAQNLLTITAVDTRTLAVHLRDRAEMLGIISTRSFKPQELLEKIHKFRQKRKESLLPKISVPKPTPMGKRNSRHKVAILDLGITQDIIRQLETLGFSIIILPYDTPPQEILGLKPDGLIISHGPEDDIGLEGVVINVRPLIKRLPIMGISTGLQVLAKALGAKVMKMKLGHRGVNYPMYNPGSYKGEITVQNHAYVVDSASLKRIKDIKITGYNLNDQTVEEIESAKLKLIGTQYLPVSPGFDEVNGIFKKFIQMIK